MDAVLARQIAGRSLTRPLSVCVAPATASVPERPNVSAPTWDLTEVSAAFDNLAGPAEPIDVAIPSGARSG
jgi:hypothetical protein